MANKQAEHGASVRIYERTYRALGNVAEWYRVSRRVLIDVLIRDRLEKLSPRLSGDLADVWKRPRTDRRKGSEFEDLMGELFKVRLRRPVRKLRDGEDALAQTSLRVTENTHAVVALSADWYGRFVPYVYDALLVDRLILLHRRMTEELGGRLPKSTLREAVEASLGIDLPTGLGNGDDDEPGLRRKLKPAGGRAGRARTGSG